MGVIEVLHPRFRSRQICGGGSNVLLKLQSVWHRKRGEGQTAYTIDAWRDLPDLTEYLQKRTGNTGPTAETASGEPATVACYARDIPRQ